MKLFKIGQVLDLPQFLPHSPKAVWWTVVH